MKKNISILIFFVLVVSAGFFYSKKQPGPLISLSEINAMDRDGQKFNFKKKIKEKFFFVHFWATWCNPCLEELPEILKYAERNPKRQFLLVSLDFSWKEADEFLRNKKIPKNILLALDPSKELSKEFGAFQFPETFLVRLEDSKVLTKWIGPQSWEDSYFEAILSEVAD